MTIYKTFDPADGFVSVEYHADRILQSRELNDDQAIQQHELRKLSDSMYADGDIIGPGARCSMDAVTGIASLEAGRIYIAGRMLDVPAAAIAVPLVGLQYVGTFRKTETMTAVDDPRLYNPATEGEGQNEAGADRIKQTARWGLAGSGQAGDFFPVWTIEDGVVKPREALSANNPITLAIRDYDKASTGTGTYVVSGMMVYMQDDDAEGNQVYNVKAGVAHVGGLSVNRPSDRTVVYSAVPNTQLVQNEPHAASGDALQTIAFDRSPVLQPATVEVQRKKVQQVNRGPIVGGADPLNENSVVKVNSVKLGGTIYKPDIDYKLTAGQIDWSPSGAEPPTGNLYEAEFEFISTEPALNQTPTTFQIANPINGTVHRVNYEFAMRRYDRLVMDENGVFNIIKGVPATWQPVAPDVPEGQLLLASIYQSWVSGTRRLSQDGARIVTVDAQMAQGRRIDAIEFDLAELRLATDVNGRYSGLKKGYFADPMLDDSMRDQGLEQTAHISSGALQLFEDFGAYLLDDGKSSYSIDFDTVVGVRQSAYSRSMAINPSIAPGQLPATVTLAPPIDRWAVASTMQYPRSIPEFFYSESTYYEKRPSVAELVQQGFDKIVDPSLVDTSGIYLREIDVSMTVAGFDPLEPVKSCTFDGKPVALKNALGQTPIANAQGLVQGTFKVPPGINVGTKSVRIDGENGSFGMASFTGSATIQLKVSYLYRASFITAAMGYGTVNYVV